MHLRRYYTYTRISYISFYNIKNEIKMTVTSKHRLSQLETSRKGKNILNIHRYLYNRTSLIIIIF